MNEAILIQQASRALGGRLPPGWKQRVVSVKSTGPDRPDGTIEITGPDGAKARVVVEAKNRVFPRDVAALKSRLERFSSGPHLVVAPVVDKPRYRHRCRSH